MAVESTLILFKPDAIEKKIVGTVIARFEAAGFALRGIKMLQATPSLLREHYAHIADKPFFPEVEAFMGKSPIIAMILEGEDAIARVRDLLGPTDSRKADKGTIRGDFGEDMMVNVCHASDSVDSAKAEVARFFAPGEVFPA